MGAILRYDCRKCGESFQAMVHRGFELVVFFCDKCGRRRELYDRPGSNYLRERLWDETRNCETLRTHCRCGGTFSANANPCCPECGSTDVALRDEEGEGLWD